jgi:hypothetical protein
VDSVAAVAVVLAESAIAGNQLTLIDLAKGCHALKAWHPFFVCFPQIRPQRKHQTVKKMKRFTARVSGGKHYDRVAVFYCRELIATTAS